MIVQFVTKLRLCLVLFILLVPALGSAANPPFKIFQIGFNKVGTTTLTDFFNRNGIPSVHWDEGKLAYSIHINHFLKRPLLNAEYLDQYVAFFDMNSVRVTPPIEVGVMYYKELDRQYPGSKFILNIRDKDAWLRSRMNHNTKYNMTLLQRAALQYRVSTTKMYEIWSEMWDAHHAAVLAYFKDRPQDLLVFDVEKDPPSKIVEFFAPYFKMDPALYGHKNKTSSPQGNGFKFFNKIYCINLLRTPERKEHMENEFQRMGIRNYEFVEAVDADSQEVSNIMHSYKVKKFPPCFRCNKLSCACSNNVLIPAQIGNWLSFIKVFKDMVKNKINYALITEDDIKFTQDAEQIFDKLVKYEAFVENDIDLNKPILIRFHGRYDPHDRDLNNIHFSNDQQLSNPCFMVNRLFAEFFLAHFARIETTSDIYIHLRLPKQYRQIQAVSAYPKPVYQLSDGELIAGVPAEFYSTIHPKGIDAADQLRKASHIKRVEYWDYLRKKLKS